MPGRTGWSRGGSAPWWPENLCQGGNPEAEIRDHRANPAASQQWGVVNKVIEKYYGTNRSRPFSMRGPEVYGSTYFRRSGGGNGNSIEAFQAVVRAASILAVRIKPRSRIGRNGENSAA